MSTEGTPFDSLGRDPEVPGGLRAGRDWKGEGHKKMLNKRSTLKWILGLSPILVISTWFLMFKFQIVGTHVDLFYAITGTYFWIVFEILGIGYLLISRLSFFEKIKPIIIVFLIFGYLVTWIFGVPAGKKSFVKAVKEECGENVGEMKNYMEWPWYKFDASFPLLPFVVLSHEEYKYGFNRINDVEALYFWDGFKAIRVPFVEEKPSLGDRIL